MLAEVNSGGSGRFTGVEVVLSCADLDPTVDFFTEQLGFRLDTIMPADDPSVAVLSGYGMGIRLVRGGDGEPGELRLYCDDPSTVGELVAPNGTRVHLVDPVLPLHVPDALPVFELTRPDGSVGGVGRAGMHYRDLLPQRQGGRFIASHILIPDGGPVPDYVHHHRVRFQMIYCAAGWVRVVYEDQGPPFLLQAGDCVLQPPGIRHRVLEASPGLEVVEIGCPAEHETSVEHVITLPTSDVRPDRRFEDQLFVRHEATAASWRPWRSAGFEHRDTGIAAATDGLAGVRVVRVSGEPSDAAATHDGEWQFWFVLSGTATLGVDGRPDEPLPKGAAVAVPAGTLHRLCAASADFEFLEVLLPG
ncbi:MAG: cupin domain-containing protein [Geodermatophilaceae bacterium]|jgi:quercetin dioxygenase-like cupin family protein